MVGPRQRELTPSQRDAVAGAGRSHHSLLEAQQRLHRALGMAQRGRETERAAAVLPEIQHAQALLAEHRKSVQGAGGLYDELRMDAPWLLPRLNQLVAQLRRLEQEAADLGTEVKRVAEGDVEAAAGIRQDAERLLASLRDLLAKESDLVFERFNEPVALD